MKLELGKFLRLPGAPPARPTRSFTRVLEPGYGCLHPGLWPNAGLTGGFEPNRADGQPW